MPVDYNDAIETSTGGRAEFVGRTGSGGFRVRIFEPFEYGYSEPGPKGKIWNYNSTGEWYGGNGTQVRIVNSVLPNDNVPEEW